MRLGRVHVGLAAAVVVIGLSVAYFSRPDPQEAFRAAIREAPGCTQTSQCTVLRTSCPLGCAHAVPTSAFDTLSALADTYTDQSRQRDGLCAQDCLPAPEVICQAGRCAFAQ